MDAECGCEERRKRELQTGKCDVGRQEESWGRAGREDAVPQVAHKVGHDVWLL